MERTTNTAKPMPHQMILQDRKRLDLTGVIDVGNFDDESVMIRTSLGNLAVRGQGIHLEHLDLESGSMVLCGEISSLAYTEVPRGGFFGRLFR